MNRQAVSRYGDVAVLFHWLIAFFIIGLLAIGKYMVSLEDNDPVRFALTQWHKSFGLTVLVLSVLRLMWRTAHKPPRDPDTLPKWQKRVAHGVHLLLYALMFFLPITGWIMVSASPLNIDTVLFDVVTIPHLPPFEQLANKEQIADWFHEIHEIAGSLMILLLLAHAGAALKHHFFDKDTVLLRMLPNWRSGRFKVKASALALAMAATGAGLYLYADSGNKAALLAAGDSEVSFMAEVTGEQTAGIFMQSQVTATIDQAAPQGSSIVAIVETASLVSENSQVESTLPEGEWFDVENHPQARFESTLIEADTEGALLVTGQLSIKDTSKEVSFPMTITSVGEKQVARGEFIISRRDFNIGMASQESEDFVSHNVTVSFRFDITQPDG